MNNVKEDKVWYAVYGTNLNEQRFSCYIKGGTPKGTSKFDVGCHDKAPAIDGGMISIPFQLYFTKSSPKWENKSVGFLGLEINPETLTLGRKYLITKEQFEDVFKQANNIGMKQTINIDFREIRENGALTVKESWFGRIVFLGTEEGFPVFTLTSYWDFNSEEVLPTILCEIDPCDSSLINSYFYADSQILARYDPAEPERYFYIHDRLGSIRLVVNESADVNNTYTYSPFGEMFTSECNETVYNPFKFTGQWFDDEIAQYYLRARMYDPHLGRFTSRDLVKGKPVNPMTLHPYLYCQNDPANKIDPTGRSVSSMVGAILGGSAMHSAAIQVTAAGVYGDPKLMELGIQMEHLVAPAMYLGAAIGSTAGLNIIYEGATYLGSVASQAGVIGARASYQLGFAAYVYAMTNPQQAHDFLYSLGNDPALPTTAWGTAGAIFNWLAWQMSDEF